MFPGYLSKVCGLEDLLQLYNQIKLYKLLPAQIPLQFGWESTCSGHYRLDLGLQVRGRPAGGSIVGRIVFGARRGGAMGGGGARV